MPIRRELRHLYRGAEYEARRERIRHRAGDKCEYCAKPNNAVVETFSGKDGGDVPFMFWRAIGPWHDRCGAVVQRLKAWLETRFIRVSCSMCHLNHDARDNREDENLRWLCNWCHLNHDKLQHQDTRRGHKDERRALLEFLTRGQAAQKAVDAAIAGGQP